MVNREKVIADLETAVQDFNRYGRDEYGRETAYAYVKADVLEDAFALLKEQQATINELYTLYDGLCKEIREKYESDDVCGLCQYDGAYVCESGDWMNECPGFETSECFCMKNSIRKMCGQPLIEDP